MDMKWKLARLSAALAHLTLSTEDFTEAKVTAEHVREVAAFLWEEYSKAGLNALAQEERHEAYTGEDAEGIVQTIAAQANVERGALESILKFLVLQGRVTRDQLRTEFGLTEHNQLRPLLASLQSNKLIVAKRGFYPTPQLIQLYKALFPDKVDKFDKVEKGTPQKSLEGEDLTPSSSDLVKVVNLDNNEAHFASEEGDADRERRAVLAALRGIKGPFSLDYALERAAEAIGDEGRARVWLKRLEEERALAQDPDGYWRLTKP
jgi:hypothetical protein